MSKNSVLLIVVGALTFSSLVVVFLGASEEPYLTFRPSQALIQVGIGSGLLALWAAWVGVVLWRVVARVVPAAWLTSIVWAVIVISYLSRSPLGYVQDLSKFGVCK